MTIEHTRGPVWCRFKIDSFVYLPERLAHEHLAQAKGIEPSCCGRPVEIAIDNVGYCRKHAGETLLRDALDGNTGS